MEEKRVGKVLKEAEDWVDEVLGCGVWIAGSLDEGMEAWVMVVGERVRGDEDITSERKGEVEGFDGFLEVWDHDERTRKKEEEVKEIRKFLETLKIPEGLTSKDKQLFL